MCSTHLYVSSMLRSTLCNSYVILAEVPNVPSLVTPLLWRAQAATILSVADTVPSVIESASDAVITTHRLSIGCSFQEDQVLEAKTGSSALLLRLTASQRSGRMPETVHKSCS